MSSQIKLGEYEHYKGHHCRVLFLAKHSETLEDMVVYEELYENELGNIWVRPLAMFIEQVEVNGIKVPRFKLVN
jgi:hypothetical protein